MTDSTPATAAAHNLEHGSDVIKVTTPATAADEVLTDVPDDAPPYSDSYEWQPATAARSMPTTAPGLPFRLSCSSCGGGIRWCELRIAETGKKCCRRCDCAGSIKGWEGLRNGT